jgi:hypothetical protein
LSFQFLQIQSQTFYQSGEQECADTYTLAISLSEKRTKVGKSLGRKRATQFLLFVLGFGKNAVSETHLRFAH